MIQAADVGEFEVSTVIGLVSRRNSGVGIVGKEGKQASLAADFSVIQFSYLTKLLMWHGRNSYRRSAKLAQFVIHRGLIISVMQAVFSAIFYFAPIALYQGWLMVGYATAYTMAPVFSLVLDRDVNEDLALLYPELYKDLTKVGRDFGKGTCLARLNTHLRDECFLIKRFSPGWKSACTKVRQSPPIYLSRAIRLISLGHFVWCRVGDYDHVLNPVRERVPEHRFHLVHSAHLE